MADVKEQTTAQLDAELMSILTTIFDLGDEDDIPADASPKSDVDLSFGINDSFTLNTKRFSAESRKRPSNGKFRRRVSYASDCSGYASECSKVSVDNKLNDSPSKPRRRPFGRKRELVAPQA